MLKRNSKVVIISAVTSILITGCAVKPEMIQKEEIKEQVKKDMNLLNEVVVPITKPISLDEAI
ncbi:MAG: transporter, partial [Aliarcobacter sp.]|nr:transporter [Aliarcobacter sp.]